MIKLSCYGGKNCLCFTVCHDSQESTVFLFCFFLLCLTHYNQSSERISKCVGYFYNFLVATNIVVVFFAFFQGLARTMQHIHSCYWLATLLSWFSTCKNLACLICVKTTPFQFICYAHSLVVRNASNSIHKPCKL